MELIIHRGITMTDQIQLTEDEKKTAAATIQPTIDKLLQSVYDAYLAAKKAAAGAAGNTPAPTPAPTPDPVATALPLTLDILAATNSTITVPANDLIVKGKVLAQLAGVQTVNVTDVVKDTLSGKAVMVLTSDQPNLVPKNLIGKKALITDRNLGSSNAGTGGTTAPVPETPAPTAPAPTPAPTPAPAGEVVTAQLNDVSNDQWERGVWKGSNLPMVSIKSSQEVRDQYTVGKEATLGNGVKGVIESFSDDYTYYNVKLAGATKLDPSKVAAPNTVSVPKTAVSATPAPTPAPSIPSTTPAVDAAGGTTVGGITFPKVTSINSRKGKKGRIFINCGMGAGGTSILPGEQGRNYALPTYAELVRGKAMGVAGFRIGFALERCIATGGASRLWTTSEIKGTRTIDSIIQVLTWCGQLGLEVMLDAHNYGRFSETGSDTGVKPYGTLGGWSVDRLGKDWYAILAEIKKNATAWKALTKIDTMNEWVDQTYPQLKVIMQSLINTIAPISEDKIIVCEGINFSSCVNWVANNPDYHTLVHPRGKQYLEFSAHLYLDQQASGYYESTGDSLSAADVGRGYNFLTIGIGRVTGFANWLVAGGVTGNLGENIVPGKYPNLLKGEIALLMFCIASGIDVYVFGMSDWFGDNQHNIELAYNAPMLTVFKAACALMNQAA